MNERQDLLRLEGVEKQYSQQRILHVDKLILREGDLVEVSGANGSGKSTLLKLLGGITPANNGCVWRAPVMKSSVLGYQPQNGGLYGDISIQDNLLLRRLLYGLKITDMKEVWYIRDLGLSPHLAKSFVELSGGYQRLAALAATLHGEPTWLLLDEPFAGVDPMKREIILENLAVLRQRLHLIVVASPQPEEIPQANKRMRMEEGQILWSEP